MALEAIAESVTIVLNTFWRLLWPPPVEQRKAYSYPLPFHRGILLQPSPLLLFLTTFSKAIKKKNYLESSFREDPESLRQPDVPRVMFNSLHYVQFKSPQIRIFTLHSLCICLILHCSRFLESIAHSVPRKSWAVRSLICTIRVAKPGPLSNQFGRIAFSTQCTKENCLLPSKISSFILGGQFELTFMKATCKT